MPDKTEEKKPENGKPALKMVPRTDTQSGKAGKAGKSGAVAAKNKKDRKSIGWWFACIILILVAITFVLPSTITGIMDNGGNADLVFGTYDGEKISFAPGTYFYDQYQAYADSYRSSQSSGSSEQDVFNIWSGAFYSTVLFTAVSQWAEQAGIIAADPVVNRRIIDGGYYDKDGKFDTETFNNATEEQKAEIDRTVRRALPASIVQSDITSVLSSDAERDYIVAMADNSRSFQYASFDTSMYPDEDAAAYGEAHADEFRRANFTIVTSTTKEDADKNADDIRNGTATLDSLASSGSADDWAYAIEDILKNPEDAETVLSAPVGLVQGPFETVAGGWTLIRRNSELSDPDFTDAETLGAVRAYITTKDNAVMDDWLSGKASAMAAAAREGDFTQAAADSGSTAVDVGSTPMNIGGSSLLTPSQAGLFYGINSSFYFTDQGQKLAVQESNAELMKQIYGAETGTVSDPVKTGNDYLVIKTGEKAEPTAAGTLGPYWNYITSSIAGRDLQQAVFTSDKFQNDFFTVFFDQILGPAVGQDTTTENTDSSSSSAS